MRNRRERSAEVARHSARTVKKCQEFSPSHCHAGQKITSTTGIAGKTGGPASACSLTGEQKCPGFSRIQLLSIFVELNA